ncbi:putative Ubiquitin-like modifier-activating enzyme atg7 [Glarea lozoyensis 74030]|uniref:Putative Ubiquitin-like modifier-activating enzyme atg7 n=1 Tax=Glarea lozoyensis (strain ATCC 74030 / MF5533) TaxID=1104152 RepID=H0EK25_GLAL7|nr:putative Ubiquitin-like modifier-activating enzyme atg7 [Glarea lozoyensis 74030]
MALKFAPFNSEIELPFYSALSQSKIDHDKLDDSARTVLGLYEPRVTDPDSSVRMRVLGNALTSDDVPPNHVRAEGKIKNVNTIEDFKNCDKTVILHTAAKQKRWGPGGMALTKESMVSFLQRKSHSALVERNDHQPQEPQDLA